MSTQPQENPITLSLFSGAGGLDIGFHRAGFRIVACVEIETAFSRTLELNRGGTLGDDCQILNRDITQLDPAEIEAERIDFIIGGPPCQSFSAIGRRAGGIDGTNNQRGSLFEHYCRLVQHYQPRGFLFENVRGILGSNKGQDWARIVAAFGALGYRLSYRVIDAADYGVPQHRERLIMVGLRDGDFHFPRPTYGPDSPDRRAHIGALAAIADLQEPDEPAHQYTGKYGHLLAEVPPGMNYHHFTKELDYPQPIFAWRSRFSDFLYKADPEKPVRTIVAQLGKYSGPFHWKNRRFTLDEFKRLQTFPDEYAFAGGLNTALRQIGNSVPPRLAEQLGKAVLQQVFRRPLGLALIEPHEALSFDARKSQRAKATRTKRVKAASSRQYGLFDRPGPVADDGPTTVERCFSWRYRSPRVRERLDTDAAPVGAGQIYTVTVRRTGPTCAIVVTQTATGDTPPAPRFRYGIDFHYPVGDGLERITCTLIATDDAGLPVAWDAIEDYLGSCSGYRSMIDVYGHFTEPHPIFDLHLAVLTATPSFVLRVAQRFSEFRATRGILPERELAALYGGHDFDLTRATRILRDHRLDVRINQTNSTIPVGYFRCCYPFTLHIDRQSFVTFRDATPLEMGVGE